MDAPPLTEGSSKPGRRVGHSSSGVSRSTILQGAGGRSPASRSTKLTTSVSRETGHTVTCSSSSTASPPGSRHTGTPGCTSACAANSSCHRTSSGGWATTITSASAASGQGSPDERRAAASALAGPRAPENLDARGAGLLLGVPAAAGALDEHPQAIMLSWPCRPLAAGPDEQSDDGPVVVAHHDRNLATRNSPSIRLLTVRTSASRLGIPFAAAVSTSASSRNGPSHPRQRGSTTIASSPSPSGSGDVTGLADDPVFGLRGTVQERDEAGAATIGDGRHLDEELRPRSVRGEEPPVHVVGVERVVQGCQAGGVCRRTPGG